jgi:RNA polymerase sigma factor (sigma-70 family)
MSSGEPGHADHAPGLVEGRGFRTTHWSVILAAGNPQSPEGRQALGRFCRSYWYPVYSFIRRRGGSHHDAQDSTQGFFAWLLEREILASVTREGGKFRSFLLTVLCRYLSNQGMHERTQKRGGGQALISIDETADTRYRAEPVEAVTPEVLFHRQWALAMLDLAFLRLGEEYKAAGKEAVFESLAGCLPGPRDQISYAEAAQALGLDQEAVRMAASRLRKRYGQALRTEIALLGCSPQETEEEIRFLMDVFARR